MIKVTAKMTASRLALLGATGLALLVPASNAAQAQAAAPKWRFDAMANTTAAPGEILTIFLQLRNIGDAEAGNEAEPIVLSGQLPTGLKLQSINVAEGIFDCSAVPAEAQSFSCPAVTGSVPGSASLLRFNAEVEPTAALGSLLTATFQVSGGAPEVSAAASTTTATGRPPFGIAALDYREGADPAGTAFTQAAGHPYDQATAVEFNTYHNEEGLKGDLYPVQPIKDVEVDLPPGFFGDPTALSQCTIAQLAKTESLSAKPLCDPSSQVGTTMVRTNTGVGLIALGPLPVYNMAPPPDAPARFGYNAAGTLVFFDVHPRAATNYGLAARIRNASEGLPVAGSTVTFWGAPADPAHTPERTCPGVDPPAVGAKPCPGASTVTPFLRHATACTAPGVGVPVTARTDSWPDPGVFAEKTIATHAAPGYPLPESQWGAPQGPEGCADVPFDPSFSAQPTTNAADSPSGLDLHIGFPETCWLPGQQSSICQSDLKDAEVKLPAGMTLNPSAATGLGACTPEQIGVVNDLPIRFDESPVACPDSAKLGTVEIATPALTAPLTGAVYLASQNDNPFHSLLGMYLVAEGSGVLIKQAGEIESAPGGRLITRFTETPQAPFSELHVSLFGGPRAALRTPPSCGEYASQARLSPWSGNAAANLADVFAISNCPGSGFDPKLSAGTQNPLAGSYSPFNLRLSRADGTEELGGLSATLPEGLIGKPAGIPYCPDATLASISSQLGTGQAQEAAPSCPAASQVGTVTVGAGAGPNPFFTTAGRAYLAGPYKGAPLSLAVVVPAVAGPFDLGSVVVRNALRLDPETAQVSAISDPFPTALHGIPLDLRDVRVDLDRNQFTLNPTSCDPKSIDAAIASVTGASAQRSERFQAAGCERLAFKPGLSLKLKGATTRAAHPALRAVLTARPGDANIASVQVALPRSEFLDQSHIKTICTRVQFAAGACPAGSVYGKATATSPLLDYPLSGPVYLRSSSHNLPDLVLSLHGPPSQPIEIDAVGRIDSFHKGIRTSFETVPDTPLTKVVLDMQGAKKGLLQNSRDICAQTYRAEVQMDAQNGKVRDSSPKLVAECGGKARHKRHGH